MIEVGGHIITDSACILIYFIYWMFYDHLSAHLPLKDSAYN